MYGVAGERRLDEWEIHWLPGYENSAPVRVGNAAALQLQIDIYGELADTIAQAQQGGLPPVPRRAEIRDVSSLPIWTRSGGSPTKASGRSAAAPQHFTHSKVMAWVAFDRASRSGRHRNEEVAHWRQAGAVRPIADVCRKGVDPRSATASCSATGPHSMRAC